jgi:uncharacterized protein (TIGR01777 family)
MKVVIAGGGGMLGRALTGRLVATGHQVVVLTRDGSSPATMANVRRVEWAPDGSADIWANEIDGAAAVINLVGASLADGRWTDARKEELRSSRVLPTRSLVAAIRQVAARPVVFIQGSAVGFYGAASGDKELDESFPPGDDFLGQLCVAWEAEAHAVTALGCRLVLLRSGVVLTSDGGMLGRLRLPFRLYLGGPIGSGAQYLSWIHIDDWLTLVVWALSTPVVSGVINATAPSPATNAAFTEAFARALGRPHWLRVPALALRLVYGEMANALLIHGQRVVPKHAQTLGFRFTYPMVEEAMKAVVRAR